MNTRDETFTNKIIKRRFCDVPAYFQENEMSKPKLYQVNKSLKKKQRKSLALMEQKRMKNGTNQTEDNFHHFSYETIAKHNPKSLYYIHFTSCSVFWLSCRFVPVVLMLRRDRCRKSWIAFKYFNVFFC